MTDQRLLARIVMGDETEYEDGANPRGRTQGLANTYDIGASLSANLHYHYEMVYESHYYILSLGFLCKEAVALREGVGWTFVSDSVQAHDYIMQTELGQKLKDEGLCFIRRMTDAPGNHSNDGSVYNHWQKSWLTEDPEEAQAGAKEQGLQVEWIHDLEQGRVMQSRYYRSAFEYVPISKARARNPAYYCGL